MSHIHLRSLRTAARAVGYILFLDFKWPLRDLSIWVIRCSCKSGCEIKFWLTWWWLSGTLVIVSDMASTKLNHFHLVLTAYGLLYLSRYVFYLTFSCIREERHPVSRLPRWQAYFLLLPASKIFSKEQTVTTNRQEPGGLFQASLNSSVTGRILWYAACFCFLWIWAGVSAKWREREGMEREINVTREWERQKKKKVFFFLFLFVPAAFFWNVFNVFFSSVFLLEDNMYCKLQFLEDVVFTSSLLLCHVLKLAMIPVLEQSDIYFNWFG